MNTVIDLCPGAGLAQYTLGAVVRFSNLALLRKKYSLLSGSGAVVGALTLLRYCYGGVSDYMTKEERLFYVSQSSTLF